MKKLSALTLGACLALGLSACTGGSDEPTAPVDFDKMPLGLDSFQRKGLTDNPITAEKVELGRHLYFDKRLSKDDTVSCASCHDPQKGWTDQAAVSTGIDGQKGGRSAPTVINRVFSSAQFWDGRAASLEEQALGPITNPIEMGMDSIDAAIEKLSKIEGYKPLFKAAFGDEKIDAARIASAIATFERTIVSGNSPADKHADGQAGAMSESAVRGLDLFKNKGRCSICHAGQNFTDEKFHNIGVGMDKPDPDKGREDFTKKAEDRGKFKTPGLRNIAEQAPYMHDGSEADLMAVVEFYNKGGIKNPTLDKEMKPLELTDAEKADLVEYLKALSGDVTPATAPTPVQ